MDALKYIDVASNLIRLIENGTFANTPNLRTVHLEYNILTDTSAITAPQLRSVFLDGNVHLHRGISKVSMVAYSYPYMPAGSYTLLENKAQLGTLFVPYLHVLYNQK